MQKPYHLRFEKALIKSIYELPSWSRSYFSSANERVLQVGEELELSSQRLHEPPFYIELFESLAVTALPVNYEFSEKKFFLFFMFENRVTFTTHEGFYTACAGKGRFAFICNDHAGYVAHLPKGYSSGFCIVFDADWLLFFSKDQPLLNNFIQNESQWGYADLPPCSIDHPVNRWLKALYKLQVRSKGSLDGHLRYYISLILDRYLQLALAREQHLSWRLKEYLDANFFNPAISYKYLATHFGENERTLRYHFQKELGISMHHFLTHKRLQWAHRLIHHGGQQIQDVYLPAGYQNESTFRYAYRKFFSSYGKYDA